MKKFQIISLSIIIFVLGGYFLFHDNHLQRNLPGPKLLIPTKDFRNERTSSIPLVYTTGNEFHLTIPKNEELVQNQNEIIVINKSIDNSLSYRQKIINKNKNVFKLHTDFDIELRKNSVFNSLKNQCHALSSEKLTPTTLKSAFKKDHSFNYNSKSSSELGTCSKYLSNDEIPLVNRAVNEDEKNFPLAFAILVYHNFVQLEQLFRVIYRPQNFYCFHIDASAEITFKKIVSTPVITRGGCLKDFAKFLFKSIEYLKLEIPFRVAVHV